MKTILSSVFACVTLFSAIPGLAQTWEWQNPLPQQSTLRGVAFTDCQYGWVVGDSGTIRFTPDSGVTWVNQRSWTTSNLTCISFPDMHNGWVAGDQGTILHTTDGGSSWMTQISGTTDRIYRITFKDNLNGWGVGDNGTIIHTSNGGDLWNAQVSGTTYPLSDVSFVSNTCGWVVGYCGTVLHTTDGGNTWVSQHLSMSSGWPISVVFRDSLIGWVAGFYMYGTNDGGNTWNGPSEVNSDLNHIWLADMNSLWYAGDNGLILHSHGRSNWETKDSGTKAFLLDITFPDSLNGWAVGYNGVILHTTDGGQTWTTNDNNVYDRITSVDFPDSINGWALAENGVIMHTSNAGQNWTVQSDSTYYDMQDIDFVDSLYGWAVGWAIIHTEDGGETWINQDPEPNGTLYKVIFTDRLNGWAAGECGLKHTANGGSSWTILPIHNWDQFIDVSSPDISHVWALGYDGMTGAFLMHSSDSGQTWTEHNGIETSFSGISFVDSLNGWGLRWDGAVFRTTDCGEHWFMQRLGDEYVSAYKILFTDTLNGTILTRHETVLFTSDGGNNWTQPGIQIPPYISDMCMVNNSCWVVGVYGTIIHYSVNPPSTVNPTVSMPSSFSLSAFPNPFNPTTTISFTLPQAGEVKLAVFDVLGRNVGDHMGSPLQAGEHHVTFDGSSLASGIYFVRLKAGQIERTQKLILMK